MLLLALDTSTRQASVALCSKDRAGALPAPQAGSPALTCLGEYTWQIGNNHSVELLERIQRLMAECGKSVGEIDAVAVARGPGSFNGLRVALATAKTLAFALHVPLVGVPTLDIIAAQQRQWRGPICAALEAGRSELYAACYLFDVTEARSDEHTIAYTMRRLGDYVLLTPGHLAAYLEEQASAWLGVPGERTLPPFLFCGELSEASCQALQEALQSEERSQGLRNSASLAWTNRSDTLASVGAGTGSINQHPTAPAFFVDGISATRHASTLALLAWELLRDGKGNDPLLLEPLYLRRPSITTSTRKQPLLGGLSQRTEGSGHVLDTSALYRATGKTEREDGALRH